MSIFDSIADLPQGPLSAGDTDRLSLSPSDRYGSGDKLRWYDPELISNPHGALFRRGYIGLGGTPTESGVNAVDQGEIPFSHANRAGAMGANRYGMDIAALIAGGDYYDTYGDLNFIDPSILGLGDEAATVGGGLENPGVDYYPQGLDYPDGGLDTTTGENIGTGWESAQAEAQDPYATNTDEAIRQAWSNSAASTEPGASGPGSSSGPRGGGTQNGGGGTTTGGGWESWAKTLGVPLGFAALNMIAAQRNAKKQQQASDQRNADFAARRAQMDEVDKAASINANINKIGPMSQTGVGLNLAGYGYRPEQQSWTMQPQAHRRGGLALHHDSGAAMNDAPMGEPQGGLNRMVGDHGGGQQDNVPALLSSKEYVMDADTVSSIGDGNPDEGARRLDEFRQRLRAHKRSAPSSKIPPRTRSLDSYMRRAA